MSVNRKKQIGDLASEGGVCYISAIVLGLNDALVELTGALAGFTIGLHNNTLIILAGLTTGVAATLSMAASEFLAQQADTHATRPYLSALITGCAYMITVILLLLPYFFLENPMHALGACLATGAAIIAFFTYTVSRIRKNSFIKNLFQMLCISFGVTAISFCISWAAKTWWGLSV